MTKRETLSTFGQQPIVNVMTNTMTDKLLNDSNPPSLSTSIVYKQIILEPGLTLFELFIRLLGGATLVGLVACLPDESND